MWKCHQQTKSKIPLEVSHQPPHVLSSPSKSNEIEELIRHESRSGRRGNHSTLPPSPSLPVTYFLSPLPSPLSSGGGRIRKGSSPPPLHQRRLHNQDYDPDDDRALKSIVRDAIMAYNESKAFDHDNYDPFLAMCPIYQFIDDIGLGCLFLRIVDTCKQHSVAISATAVTPP